MENKYACMVGRFNPLHLGHEAVIREMIFDFGIDNCLLIVGSSQEKNTEKNIFSYEDRRVFLKKIFPDLNIVALNDYDSNDNWYMELEKILKLNLDSVFADILFYGGSKDDLRYVLDKGFSYKIIDRYSGKYKKISATKVREILLKGKSLDGLVSDKLSFSI